MDQAAKVRRTRGLTALHGGEWRVRYEAGASMQELADEYGVTKGTVWRTIKALGGETRTSNVGIKESKQVVADRALDIARDYASGETLQVVAGRFGLKESTVAKVVRAQGGEVRKRGFGSNPEKFRGPGNPAWKGGSYMKQGYRQIWLDSADPLFCMTGGSSYAPEHRIVMARLIHRPLASTETVHHIDGDRSNNDPSNLQLRQGQHGNGVHIRCGDCGSANVVAQEL